MRKYTNFASGLHNWDLSTQTAVQQIIQVLESLWARLVFHTRAGCWIFQTQTPLQLGVWDQSLRKPCGKSISLCAWVRMPLCTKWYCIKVKFKWFKEAQGSWKETPAQRMLVLCSLVSYTEESIFAWCYLMLGGTHIIGKKTLHCECLKATALYSATIL